MPVGNAAGDLITSWVNPTSIVCGLLSVATGALLAAVDLAADAHRIGKPEMELAFRTRALVSGLLAGLLAVVGLLTVRVDANRVFRGLTTGYGLTAVIVSAVAGMGTIALAWTRRFQLARASVALSVTAVLAGWAARATPDRPTRSHSRAGGRRRQHHGLDHRRGHRRWTVPGAGACPVVPTRPPR